MRALSAATRAALEAREVKIRDFVYFTVRNRTSGADVTAGYWSDVGQITAQVIDPETQGVVSRNYAGAGTLIAVSAIPLVSNLTVQAVTVELSRISGAEPLIREYDARQGRIEIHRGLFHKGSLEQIEPAFPRFFGFIDDIESSTPAENEEGGIVLTCVSHTQELTRSNPATRSDAYQRKRLASDSFRRHCAAISTWDIKWGTKGE